MKIQLKQVVEHGRAWHDQGAWRALAGRILVQWRDYHQAGPYLLAPEGADPAAALASEVEQADHYGAITASAWDDAIHAYRVRMPAELAADGYDEAAISEAYQAGLDDVLEEVAVDGTDWHPAEPPCRKHSRAKLHPRHKWRMGDLRGSGGGIRYTETCRRCGCQRLTDTWATSMADGSQGHTQIRYRDADGDLLERPAVRATAVRATA